MGDKISKKELQEAMNALSARGVSRFNREKVKATFRGDVDESGLQAGIDRKELAKGLDYLKKSGMSKETIAKVDEALKKKM
jgi:hypothetical protein